MDPTQAPIEAAHDFSFLGLFLQADPIVKGVMILLVVASIACWTVVFEKIIRLAAARRTEAAPRRSCGVPATSRLACDFKQPVR